MNKRVLTSDIEGVFLLVVGFRLVKCVGVSWIEFVISCNKVYRVETYPETNSKGLTFAFHCQKRCKTQTCLGLFSEPNKKLFAAHSCYSPGCCFRN